MKTTVSIFVFVFAVMSECAQSQTETVSTYDASGNVSVQLSSVYVRILEVGSGYPYTTIQAAVDVVTAGDTILIHAGTYTNSCVIGSCGGGTNYSADASLSANVKLKTSGTLANPITIKSAGDGEVIIEAQGTVQYNIYGVSYQYYIIDGITLKDALQTSLFWQGNSSLDLTVKNCRFQRTASAPNNGYGISVNNSGDAANNNTYILNNTFSLPGAFVVIDITASNNSLISGNTITGGDYGIYLHNYTEGSIIEENTVIGNTGDLTGIFIRDADNIVIRYNLIKGSYANYHILYQDENNISTGVKILNNTIDCGATSSTGIKESDTWAEITNNIIYNCFVDIRGINPANLPAGQPGYNILYDVPGRYATSYRYFWGAEQWPVGSGNLTSDPLFVSAGTDYKLQKRSPAINAGDPSISRPTSWGRIDIGRYEWAPDTITSVDDGRENIPQGFVLYQNYPNPFNPTTTIRFSISQRSYVMLKVFDLLGREVATLVESELNPGEHSVIFKSEGLASGVYFYQLRAAGFIQTRKMLITR